MITLPNKDRLIQDLEYRVVDIIKEYQETGEVIISTNYEGICLDHCNFYSLLDYICEKFNINKSKVTIETCNRLEKHDQYKIITQNRFYFASTKESIPNDYIPSKEKLLKHIGCFVGKLNWNRAIILSWLAKNYADQCLLTCHYKDEDAHKLESELTELNFFNSSELSNVVEFLKYCPIEIDESFEEFTILQPKNLTIIKQYKNIFLDLVAETYIMGNTFYVTEKTLRPIIAKTPFIILGPKNYLANLKQLGYKTFSKWWDESYDHHEGVQRIEEIKKILQKILAMSTLELQLLITDMNNILNYNYDHYMDHYVEHTDGSE